MNTTRRSRKAGLSSAVGTTIEWYEFFIYGTAAGLVFNKLFFPDFDPIVGTLLAFATFGSAFIARPIGAVIFGHFGDRIGRKSMLVITLSIIGITTFGVGLLPTYAQIGVAAPIILVLLRFIQGLSLGGEYGGAVLMAVEHAPPDRRGYYGSWVQMGVPAGLILGNVVFLGFAAMPEEMFLQWGWRVPFLISALFVIFALWVRLTVAESPAVESRTSAEKERRLPITIVVREYGKEVVLTGGAYLAVGVTFYTCTVFGLSYGAQNLGYSSTEMLIVVLLSMVVVLGALPVFGRLSDRVGRRPVFLAGIIGMGGLAFPWFWALNTGSVLLATLGTIAITVAFAVSFGPLAAFFAEAFEDRIRYSGISFGYTLGTVASSALAPVIASWILARTDSYVGIGWYMIAMAVLSAICVALMRDRHDLPLPDGHPRPRDRKDIGTGAESAERQVS